MTDCHSAAKNYFIKYGELGVLSNAAERVIPCTVELLSFYKNLVAGSDEAEAPTDVGEKARGGWHWHESRRGCC